MFGFDENVNLIFHCFRGRYGKDSTRWSDDLKKLDERPTLKDYVMAPRDENVYGRARIIEFAENNPDYAYVIFIDHGDCCWVHWV